MDSFLEYYEVSFWDSFYGLCFEVYFVWYKQCYPSFFFPSLFAWNIFFPALHFSLCRSFVLRWATCRQHMCGSWFLIHSAILYRLIGPLNPYMFKVIIDRYLFIAIFCTCVPLSLTLFFAFLKAVPLAPLAELVWWRCILLAFFFLGNSLFHLPF